MGNSAVHMDEDTQESRLYRLGVWCARHWRRVIAVWIGILIVAVVLTPRFLDQLTSSAGHVPGSESDQADDLIADRFGAAGTGHELLVFHSEARTVDDPAYRAVVDEALAMLRGRPEVADVAGPFDPGGLVELISADRRTALAEVGLSGDQSQRQDAAAVLQGEVQRAARSGVQVYLTGPAALSAAVVEQEAADLEQAELIGIPVAAVVLLLAFGTVVAAGLPLGLALTGVLAAFGALGAVSFLTSIDSFVESLVIMMGLALGIDYSLLVVTRFREARAAGGSAPDGAIRAVGAAMATAGRSVLFSGAIVMISMGGILLVRMPMARAIAGGVILVVGMMVAVSLTLLPALLGALRARVDRLPVPGLRRSVEEPDPERSGWGRWTRVVMRRPVAIGGVAAILLLAPGLAVFGLRLGVDTGTDAVADLPAGRGYALVGRQFAAGATHPIQAVVVSDRQFGDSALSALDRFTTDLSADPRARQVISLTEVLDRQLGGHDAAALAAARDADGPDRLGRILSSAGDATIVTIYPRDDADAEPTRELVRWLRGPAEVAQLAPEGLRMYVGGQPARVVDQAEEIRRATPVVIAAVLGASFLLLLLAFRSLLVPLKAIVMNLLVVAAAFGILVAVFQHGVGGSLLGVTEPGPIATLVPLAAFAILFGLSMDYEVFLVSRMREEWDRSHHNEQAVAAGVTYTARVITAAAAIMVVIFASFLVTSVVELKQLGFALAVAVLIDATLVRLLLVPSVMRLLGPANWWLPAWLDRLLPRVSITDRRPPPVVG